MLDLPPLGNINVHASLLPKYRGAAPIQWAIAQGETITGVTTMKIDAGLDTGDILLKAELAIDPPIRQKRCLQSSLLLARICWLKPCTRFKPSSRSRRTTPNQRWPQSSKKKTGKLNFDRTAYEICNRLRGFQPWPGAFTSFRGKNLQVTQANASKANSPAR